MASNLAGMTSMHDTGEWPAHKTFVNVSVVHNVICDPAESGPVGSNERRHAQRNGANAENVAMVTVEFPAGGFLTVWADGTVQVSNELGYHANYQAIAVDGQTYIERIPSKCGPLRS